MTRTLPPGSQAVIATFALDSPEMCSGLPVRRYDARSLAAELGHAFQILKREQDGDEGAAEVLVQYCRSDLIPMLVVQMVHATADEANANCATTSIACVIQRTNASLSRRSPTDGVQRMLCFVLRFGSFQGVKRVRLFETSADANTNIGMITLMDNVRFEAIAAAPVPLPLAAPAGMAIMGFIWMKRKPRLV